MSAAALDRLEDALAATELVTRRWYAVPFSVTEIRAHPDRDRILATILAVLKGIELLEEQRRAREAGHG